jgi:hypothetical protein
MSGDVLLLAIEAAVFCAVGLWVFRVCERAARRRGVIGHY